MINSKIEYFKVLIEVAIDMQVIGPFRLKSFSTVLRASFEKNFILKLPTCIKYAVVGKVQAFV